MVESSLASGLSEVAGFPDLEPSNLRGFQVTYMQMFPFLDTMPMALSQSPSKAFRMGPVLAPQIAIGKPGCERPYVRRPQERTSAQGFLPRKTQVFSKEGVQTCSSLLSSAWLQVPAVEEGRK